MKNRVLSGLMILIVVLLFTGCGAMSGYPWTKPANVEQAPKQERVLEVVVTPVKLPVKSGTVIFTIWDESTVPAYLRTARNEAGCNPKKDQCKKAEIPWQKIMECAEKGQCKETTSSVWVDVSENDSSLFEAVTLVTSKMSFAVVRGSSIKLSAVPEKSTCQITSPVRNMTHNSGHVVTKYPEDWVHRDGATSYLHVHMLMKCQKSPAAKLLKKKPVQEKNTKTTKPKI